MWAWVFTNWSSRESQRGAAALEFALVAPVLLLLLVGTVDFGMVLGAQTQVSNAAREGARAGALTGLRTEADSAARSATSGMAGVVKTVAIDCWTPTAACSWTDETRDTGNTVIVTITYEHKWLSPVMLGFAPTVTLQGKSQMRIEA